MVQKLAGMLAKKRKDISLIHHLFYTFSAPPDDDTPAGRWLDSLKCFIAISNLMVDGSFKHVLLVTKDFSKWEYLLRSSVLYEISSYDGSIRDMER